MSNKFCILEVQKVGVKHIITMEENTQNSENGPIPFLMSIEEPDIAPAGATGVDLVFFAEY